MQGQEAEPSDASASNQKVPQRKRRKHVNPDWDAHESELRQLYLIENKTLAETKQEMENKHGFVVS